MPSLAQASDLLLALTGRSYGFARQRRDELVPAALDVLGEAETGAALEKTAGETAVVTLLAGAGSRWIRSIEAFREEWPAELGEDVRQAAVGFALEKPRGLFPVTNYLPGIPGEMIPVAAYSLAAVKGVGEQLIMTGGYDREIEETILEPLGYDRGEVLFQHQEMFRGSPLGHGAAAWQCRRFWEDKRYVLFNFGGDANSRRTVEESLLVMAALDVLGEAPALLLPAALVPNPDYTIEMDKQGLPRHFEHSKLTGPSGAGRGRAEGYSNVGLRVYRGDRLGELLGDLHRNYFDTETGYVLPENQGNELALDNVDRRLAEGGEVRILASADSREITPAKTLDSIPRFLEAVKGLASGGPERGS